MTKKKGENLDWGQLMERVQDMPLEERARPLEDRVAEAEALLTHPEGWGMPLQVRMGRPRKEEAREAVENISVRAPRALKAALAAAAETQGMAPSEVLRRLTVAYVDTMLPKPRRKRAPAPRKVAP